jgi:hypothetical protein
VWAAVPGGKVKLIKIAETVSISYRSKPGTHDSESMIGLFNESWIVLEICAVLADRPGIKLNGIKNFHASMRSNGRPVMTENNY